MDLSRLMAIYGSQPAPSATNSASHGAGTPIISSSTAFLPPSNAAPSGAAYPTALPLQQFAVPQHQQRSQAFFQQPQKQQYSRSHPQSYPVPYPAMNMHSPTGVWPMPYMPPHQTALVSSPWGGFPCDATHMQAFQQQPQQPQHYQPQQPQHYQPKQHQHYQPHQNQPQQPRSTALPSHPETASDLASQQPNGSQLHQPSRHVGSRVPSVQHAGRLAAPLSSQQQPQQRRSNGGTSSSSSSSSKRKTKAVGGAGAMIVTDDPATVAAIQAVMQVGNTPEEVAAYLEARRHRYPLPTRPPPAAAFVGVASASASTSISTSKSKSKSKSTHTSPSSLVKNTEAAVDGDTDDPDANDDDAPAQSGVGEDAFTETIQAGGRRAAVCKFHRRGHCRSGSKCPFSHPTRSSTKRKRAEDDPPKLSLIEKLHAKQVDQEHEALLQIFAHLLNSTGATQTP